MRSDLGPAEYQALRATIRERGSLRMGVILAGLVAWAVLVQTLFSSIAPGGLTLVPLLILGTTFEISFFIHTGVERIGRYVQVFFEEASGVRGWETTAMHYGSKFRGGLDPLLASVFAAAAAVNLLASLSNATRRPGWMLLSLLAHSFFAYRLFAARRSAAAQRALDLYRFRELRNLENYETREL